MDLNTNGYVANGIYDNIRGMGGYGTAFEMDAHGYEQTQSIKDQATLLNLYQDNKGERRADRIDDKICQNELMGQSQTSSILQKLSDCCCENKVAITALNGKIDLTAANAKAEMVAMENRQLQRDYDREREDNNFNKRGQFIMAGSPCVGK